MKLRHRFSLSIFAVGTICVVAMVADRVQSTKALLAERASARAEALAGAIAREIAEPLKQGDSRMVHRRLELFAELSGVERIEVSDVRGRTIDSAGRQYGQTEDGALWRSAREMFAGPSGGAMVVEVTMASIGLERAILPILARGVLWGGLSTVLLALVSWWFGRLAGRKIERLIDATARLEGDGTLALPDLERNSEIGALSRAFQELRRRHKEEGERRRALEEQRDDMTNMLVHDLKHPLTVLRMTMSILDDAVPSVNRAEIATAQSLARRSIIRIEAMIDGVLQTAMHLHAAAPPKRVRTPVLEFLMECAVEDSLIAKSSGRPWREAIDRGLTGRWILADRAMLRRMIGNLVLNAIDHSPEGTPLTFGARLSDKDASFVEFFVENTDGGLGSDPEALLRGRYQGSGGAAHAGIGLAFCQQAARRHSGRLDAQRLADSQIVFSVTIPMGSSDSLPAPAAKEVVVHETA